MSHSHAPKFAYQPALPIPNGKTCLWLFLSTEIMFFAGLIGTYIVLRFGAIAWPAPHDVHLSEPIGAFNTFVLICSSVTVVLALEAAKGNQTAKAKGYILLTFLLGQRVPGRQGVRVSAEVFARHLPAAAARPGLRQGRHPLRRRRPQAAGRAANRSSPTRRRSRCRQVVDDLSRNGRRGRDLPFATSPIRRKAASRSWSWPLRFIRRTTTTRWRMPRRPAPCPKGRPCAGRISASGRTMRRSRRSAGARRGIQRSVSLAEAADHDSRRTAVGQHLFPAHRLPCAARAGRPDCVLP